MDMFSTCSKKNVTSFQGYVVPTILSDSPQYHKGTFCKHAALPFPIGDWVALFCGDWHPKLDSQRCYTCAFPHPQHSMLHCTKEIQPRYKKFNLPLVSE